MDSKSYVRFATRFVGKLKGKLFDDPKDPRVLVLAGCHDVHTYGMSFGLDLAFIDESGSVLKSMRNVGPRKRVGCRGACIVLERAADDSKSWFEAGQRIAICPASELEDQI